MRKYVWNYIPTANIYLNSILNPVAGVGGGGSYIWEIKYSYCRLLYTQLFVL
jgi:hypothetical protein